MKKTSNKQSQLIELLKQEIFQLREIIANFPGDVYWKDNDGVWLGINEKGSQSLREMGFLFEPRDVIGKTDKEIFGEETAIIYRKNDLKAINEQCESFFEETTTLPSGKKVIKCSIKKPLYNQKKEIVGIIGSSVDITVQKEAEALKLENAKQKIQIEEQEKFKKVADQLAHDIRSPVTTLRMLMESEESIKKIPENMRMVGRNAITRIMDIANSGLNQYKMHKIEENEKDSWGVLEKKRPVMMSIILDEILAEKRLEYQKNPVKFETHFEKNALFVFFQVELCTFKRMISNLINNAIEAFDENSGKVIIHLDVDPDERSIIVIIEDTAKGMPLSIIEKIMQNVSVTSDKKEGYGIGYTQIQEALKINEGKIVIDSTLGCGTKIKLIFPQVVAPDWSINTIELTAHDCVVIVDDDSSIHDAWITRLDRKNFHNIQIPLIHFEDGNCAINFLKHLTLEEKQAVFLLTDYELLGQSVNGLDIIQQTKIDRSIIVTSYSDNKKIQERAVELKTKILPKFLAAYISISLKRLNEIPHNISLTSDAEVVLIDDDFVLIESIQRFAFPNKKVDKYTDPHLFLRKMTQYSKETLFFMDNNFEHFSVKGFDIAEILYQQGYSYLYLLSGESFEKTKSIPNYLTVILKTDTEHLSAIANGRYEKSLPLAMAAEDRKDMLINNIQVSNFSHDIRNVLASININADLIGMMQDKQLIVEYVKNIKQAIKTCTNMTDRMSIVLKNIAKSKPV